MRWRAAGIRQFWTKTRHFIVHCVVEVGTTVEPPPVGSRAERDHAVDLAFIEQGEMMDRSTISVIWRAHMYDRSYCTWRARGMVLQIVPNRTNREAPGWMNNHIQIPMA